MAVPTPAQTFIITESDPALQRDFGNTIQTTISPLSQNAVIFVNTSSVLNSYTNIFGGVASGNTGEIQFNVAGSFAADSGLIFNPVNNILGVGGALVSGIVVTDSLLHANGEPWNFVNPTASAGGLNTQLQFNNSNALGGIPDIQYFSSNNVLSLGDLSNLRIAGGATGQFIQTDGVGNLTFVDSFPLAAGNDTEIQFNNASVTSGAANFTYDHTTERVGVSSLSVSDTAIINNLIVDANITGGNITISGRSTLTGNVSTGNLTSNNINATSIIANANITAGNTINAARANIAANATIGSISTGTIAANGNINFTGANVSLGPVGNVRITGGSSGQVLRTDGTGTLSWSTISSTGAAGTNTQIQFNDANLTAGANNLTYNKITQTLTANKLVVSTQANLGAAGNVIITGGAKSNAVLGAVSFNGSGAITNIAVTTGGSGYDLPPVITISGSNTSPATAAAVIDSATGTVLSVTIVTAGLGYNVGSPTATIAPPGTKFLSTDGAGNLSWRENGSTGGGGASPSSAGPNTAVQFNDAGVIGGSSAFVFNKTTGLVTVSNNLTVTGNISVANLSVSANAAFSGANVSLGAIANLRITGGSANQFLQTNGSGTLTFAAIDQSQISNGNSNVKVAANSVVTINASGASGTWTFGTDGSLTFPNDSKLVAQGALTQLNSANSGFIVLDAKNSSAVSTASVINDGTNAAVFIKTVQLPAAIDNFWAFSNTGNLSFPANGSLILSSNNGTAVRQISIKSSTNANFTANYTLTLPVDDGANGQVLTTDGSGILTWGTPLSGSSISNGNSNATVALNGNITINANAGSNEQWVFATDGTVAFPGNTLTAPANSSFSIRTTNGNSYTNFIAEPNNAISIGIQDNNTGANPGWGYMGVSMTNANTPTAFILLQTADTGRQLGWGFNSFGNLSIPANGTIDFLNNNGTSIRQVSLKASSNNTFTANYTLTLPVNDGSNGQVLATDGSGILSWATISSSSISNGNSNVTVAVNGNITINANASVNEPWVFDTDGNLTLPTSGNINFSAGGIWQTPNEDLIIRVQDDDDDGWSVFTQVDDGAGNVLGETRLQRDQFEIGFPDNSVYYQFNDDKRMVIPGDIWGNYAGNLTVQIPGSVANSFISLQTRDNTDTLKSNVNVNTTNVTISTSNATKTWKFDALGNLTIPGNIYGTNSGSPLIIDAGAEGNAFISIPSFQDGGELLTIENTYDASTGGIEINTNGDLDLNGKTVNLVGNTEVTFTTPLVSLGPVGNVSITGGSEGAFLQTDGSGNLNWQTISSTSSFISNGNSSVSVAANSNVTIDSADKLWIFDTTGNLVLPTNTANINYANGSPFVSIPTSITNGNSNISVAANANVTISANGTANVVTVVSSGNGNLDTTGMLVNGFVYSPTTIAGNSFILGNSTTTVNRMSWLGASTVSTTPDQVLYTTPSEFITSIDFHVTATGLTGSGNSRQVSKMIAVTRDLTTNFTEYGGMWVGANLGDFNVIQTGSNIELVVTPTTANIVQYNIILTTYF